MYSFEQIAKVLGISTAEAFKAFQDIQVFFFKKFGTGQIDIEIHERLTADEAEMLIVAVADRSSIDLLLAASRSA
ncbi:MAG: hypothetical protein WBA07_04880 [Rivularia sp. (in: cyanobacteria)]